MALARIDEVVDAVAAKIQAAWNPAAPDEVVVEDEIDIVTDPTDPDVIQGRKVYVLPDAYDNPEPASRGEDVNDYRVLVLIARLYPDDGRPTKAWVRLEREWVERMVYQPLTDARGEKLLSASASGGLWPVNPSGVETVYDHDELKERKLFFSVVRVTYREVADA